MWIERIELLGFGSLRNQSVKFKEKKINLVIQPNEYGKSTIAEAIWAVLYDYPSQRSTVGRLKEREIRKPIDDNCFKASLDLVHKIGNLRVVRDFNERTVHVFDRGRGDVDVTSEYMISSNQDEVGLRLTGMDRELFRSTCFVGQRELDENAFGGDRDLSSLIQSIADGSGSATTSATAIGVLQDALDNFSFKGKKYKIERLIRELEERHEELIKRTNKLEDEQLVFSQDAARLTELETRIAELEKQIKSAEYVHLCLEAADLDSRLVKAQEGFLRLSDLKRELGTYSYYQNFPIELKKRVDELWMTRQSRVGDYERLSDELGKQEQTIKMRDLELRERFEGLANFTIDDVQAMMALGRTLGNFVSELSEAKQKRLDEFKRVEDNGVDLSNLAGTRRALLNLDQRDLDDAYAYHAMVISARDQIGQCERSTWRAQAEMKQVEEERKHEFLKRKGQVVVLGFLAFVLALLSTVIVILLKQKITDPLAAVGMIGFSVVASALLVVSLLLIRSKTFHEREYNQAKREEQQQGKEASELNTKIVGLEIKLEDLARKAGIASGAELVHNMEVYARTAARLKDLDLLEQVISSRQAQVVKLESEIEEYLVKAGRKSEESTVDEVTRLADDISHYLDEKRSLEAASASLESRSSELGFLQDQIRDIDSELRDHFLRSAIDEHDNVELAHKEFLKAVSNFEQWQSIRSEIDHIGKDISLDFSSDDLPKLIEHLKLRRDHAWSALEEMVERFPDVVSLTPAILNPADPAFGREVSSLRDTVEDLVKLRQELVIRVRTAGAAYDEQSITVPEEKEEVERDLKRVKQVKRALELARDTFEKLSDETHSHWSSRLNEISKEMLGSLGTEFESIHFDSELQLTARRKGLSEPLQASQIKGQVSVGAREQLHWLARMAICRYLSQESKLPVVLDEPFSETDDERFLRMIRFLMNCLLQHHQIILFSCHQARHRWLLEQLEPEQCDLLEFCTLESSSVKVK